MLPEKMNDNSMRGKMSDPLRMDVSPEGMKEKGVMNESMQSSKMQMNQPDEMSRSQFSSKKYKKYPMNRDNSSSFRSEDSHANSQYQADVEPAIHYIPSDSLVDVIPIQGSSEGMMESVRG
jgi:hypothetical protein